MKAVVVLTVSFLATVGSALNVAASTVFQGAIVSPQQPEALTVSPSGTLYVIDGGRDQILRLLPNGRFQVVAGNGIRGFTGDGGPAIDAEIHVGYQAGIAVTKNGTIYFSDDWNDRVREVLPDGIIKTVAGGGTKPLGTKSEPALSVSFSGPFSLFDLTIGPDGDLYIGTSAVYRLTPGGDLDWVVGERSENYICAWDKNPGCQGDFSPATRLAFDGKGDLLVAGGGGFGLYEKTASGMLRFAQNFRGDGYWGSLASAPGGSVVLAERDGLFRFSASGAILPIRSASLSAPLGRMNGGPHENTFIGGAGVAVGPTGEIYVDADTGNTFTSVSAILAVSTQGRVSAVWKS